MIRELQATRRDYEAYIKCKYKAGISKKIGEPSVNVLTEEKLPTFENYIYAFKQRRKNDDTKEYVYEADGEIVAMAIVIQIDKYASIQEISVIREYQLNGFGRKFYQELEEKLINDGVRTIFTKCFADGGIAFFNKMGFIGEYKMQKEL